jgi:hypothetical protein
METYDYTDKNTTPAQLDAFVRHFAASLELVSNIYLGIGTFPFDPYESSSWKNKYQNCKNHHELEIIKLAQAKGDRSIIYFVDGQYRRISDSNGWIHICNSLNQTFRDELAEYHYNDYYTEIIYKHIKIVYVPIYLPTDYNSSLIQNDIYLAKKNRFSWLDRLEKYKRDADYRYNSIYNMLSNNIIEYLADTSNKLYIINRAISYGHFFVEDQGSPKPIHITTYNQYYEELAEIIAIVRRCYRLGLKNLILENTNDMVQSHSDYCKFSANSTQRSGEYQ